MWKTNCLKCIQRCLIQNIYPNRVFSHSPLHISMSNVTQFLFLSRNEQNISKMIKHSWRILHLFFHDVSIPSHRFVLWVSGCKRQGNCVRSTHFISSTCSAWAIVCFKPNRNIWVCIVQNFDLQNQNIEYYTSLIRWLCVTLPRNYDIWLQHDKLWSHLSISQPNRCSMWGKLCACGWVWLCRRNLFERRGNMCDCLRMPLLL